MKMTASALLLALLTGCAAGTGSNAQATPQPQATMLIESRGVVTPFTAAVKSIAFRPIVPSSQMAAVALIPPISGEDSRKTHGLAIEYAGRGDALLLSQWPRPNVAIEVDGTDITARPCAPVAYKTDGLIWSTRSGLVMTLQPDGKVPLSRLAREAHRLLAAGGCRRTG